MGRLNGTLLRYLEKEDFRVLTAVEMGMKNHEIVPLKLIASISGVREGTAFKILGKLTKHRLTAYEAGKSFDGYRLTTTGYDYLALNSLVKQGAVFGLGSQVGVGKESDVYLVSNEAGEEMCLKLCRLGRTSFRQLKNKRDYHRHRQSTSWLYLSRIAAEMEYSFMKALYEHKFPVPIPIAYNRHAVLMSVAEGYPLCQIDEMSDPPALCSRLLEIVSRLATLGMIHGDFNEFNILVGDGDDEDETSESVVTVIDFPQMVSTSHRNAEFYFDRDVAGIRDFFAKKFGYVCTELPTLANIKRVASLDVQLKASGYNHNSEDNQKTKSDEESSESCGDESAEEAESDIAEEEEKEGEKEDEKEEAEGEEIDGTVDKTDDPSASINEIRAIVRKQLNKQRTKQSRRLILQSATSSSSRERRKFGRSSDIGTEDVFVKLLEQ